MIAPKTVMPCCRGWPSRRGLRFAIVLVLLGGALIIVPSPFAAKALAGDTPAGFYYGTDSNQPTVDNSGGEYSNSFTDTVNPSNPTYTTLGGAYGGYFGRVGGYYQNLGCANEDQNNSTNASAAESNYNSYGAGIGFNNLFLLAGPGRDPNFSSSYTDNLANAWGKAQGIKAYQDWASSDGTVIWADLEAPDGWNNWYDSGCSPTIQSTTACCKTSFDRWVVNGFQTELANYGLTAGMYASRIYWDQETMGCVNECTSGNGYLPSIPEWTYGDQTQTLPSESNEPSGWSIGTSVAAYFFAGQNKDSSTADAWQWAANYTTTGDYDQIDATRVGG